MRAGATVLSPRARLRLQRKRPATTTPRRPRTTAGACFADEKAELAATSWRRRKSSPLAPRLTSRLPCRQRIGLPSWLVTFSFILICPATRTSGGVFSLKLSSFAPAAIGQIDPARCRCTQRPSRTDRDFAKKARERLTLSHDVASLGGMPSCGTTVTLPPATSSERTPWAITVRLCGSKLAFCSRKSALESAQLVHLMPPDSATICGIVRSS
mmetsp:Transcript_457/g.1153  ORF Transcript_457/g.1153 Transcript_457/m.1153 type:complete len:213 (+) Transcript_457:130-768(+)